jgi:N-acetylmuramoyl-L-alanine amidase
MTHHVALPTLAVACLWLFLQNFNTTLNNPAAPKSGYRIKKVVLDAGHGGKDPGCIGSVLSAKEKHSALAIVLKLGARIEQQYPDVDVLYTRKTDVFVDLKERAAIANRNNADLFISVHCNAMPNSSSVKGAETYVLGLHKSEHNLEVAKRENASIYLEDNYQRKYEGYDPNSPEAHIMSSMWQSAYMEQSIVMAGAVQKYARTVAERQDKGVKQAGFVVLKEVAAPAVLIEAGYMTNREEEAFLASDYGQEQTAESIFRAFRAYKEQMEGNAVALVTPSVPKGNNRSTGSGARKPSPTLVVNTPAPAPVVEKTIPSVQYRILLMTWNSRMDRKSGQLGLLSDVQEEKDGSQYKYFTGTFSSLSEAERTLPEIKNLGFRTAVIVAK